jgi:hypothetical protein
MTETNINDKVAAMLDQAAAKTKEDKPVTETKTEPKAKTEPEPKAAFPWDEPGSIFIQKNSRADLGIFRSEYKGVDLLNIREFSVGYDRKTKTETRYPTKKGFSIAIKSAGELVEALTAILDGKEE